MGFLALLAVVAAIGLAGAFALALFVKAVLWVVLLPVRLVFWFLLLPLLFVLKLVFGAVLLLVAAPVMIVATLVAMVAALAALAVPLLPVLFIAFVVWLLVRSSKRAVA